MRAIQCVEWGDPDKLVLAELPLPQPQPGEIRICVGAAGVNFPDGLIIQRKYQVQPELPFIPGTEVAGRVDAVGEGVTDVRAGERVVAFVGVGGFAEAVCVPASQVVTLPEHISDQVAAAFTLTYATAHHALIDRAQLKSRETLLVLGAGGGVGLAAIQIGKLIGARVIAAASTDEKLAAAHRAGADDLVNYSTLDLRDSVKTITAGKGVDVIFDPVGGAYTEAALRAIAWRGRLLVIGFANGEIPRIPANLLLIKGASAVGVFWGDFARREPAANRMLMSSLFGWLAQGRLQPQVAAAYPLAQTAEAIATVMQRRAVGKLVVTP